jgi:FSR family fosmidomycin resistance protein-like MFS transporter
MTSNDNRFGAADAPLDREAIGLLTAGHFLIDLCQGMVPALLPFFFTHLDLSYTGAASLVFASSAASSVVQPLFGQMADRSAFRWLLPASVLVTGLAFAAGSQSGDYLLLFAALAVSGLGVAAFHPEAARLARMAAGGKPATGMSVFAVGGSLGFAVAPGLTATLLFYVGQSGVALVIVPTIVMGVLLALRFRGPASPGIAASPRGTTSGRRDDWRAFWQLCGVTLCRSIIFVGLYTFLALYWDGRWPSSAFEGWMALSVFLGVGLAGTLLGGWLGDRWGQRAVLRTGFAIAAVLLPLFLVAGDSVSAVVLLAALAGAFGLSSSVLVVLGQEYLPNRVGVASGVTLGLAVSAGGMAAPALGWVADQLQMGVVLIVIEAILLAAALQAFLLPRPSRRVLAEEVLEQSEPMVPSPDHGIRLATTRIRR